MKQLIIILSLIICFFIGKSQTSSFQIAVVKYNGGGDWYANPTSLTNLIKYSNKNLKTNINEEYTIVEIGSTELFNYPFLHLTGHGNIVLSKQEAENLRNYLISGGFLHIDDNYGIDKFIRPQMKKVFPELEFIELPYSHPIYNQKYKFPQGLPKIHEHDNKAPQGFGLVYEGRLVCFYSYECDLGDGWEDQQVHKDSETTRTKALQMGCNILQYVFSN